MLPGTQALTALLIILPFQQGFGRFEGGERWLYVAIFGCSLASLIFLSTPAVQRRLTWPSRLLARRERSADRLPIVGLAAHSLALILATWLVAAEVVGGLPAFSATALVALLLGVTWWLLPLIQRARGDG